MNERGAQLPDGDWRGRQWGAGGTLPAPAAPRLPATQGGTPTVCCLCPSQAMGTAAYTRVPPSTCGLRASCLCSRPGPGRTQAFLCLRLPCPLRVPEALPGPELEGPFPLDSRLVPAVPSPTSGRDPKALSPWVRRAGGQGGQGVGRLASCPEEPPAWSWALRGPDGQMCVSPRGRAPLGRVPGLSTPQGQSSGEPSPRGTLRQSCWIQHETAQDAH